MCVCMCIRRKESECTTQVCSETAVSLLLAFFLPVFTQLSLGHRNSNSFFVLCKRGV